MKDKMDLMWGIEQMEKELAKIRSPASNIMSICTEVKKQVSEILLIAGQSEGQSVEDWLKEKESKRTYKKKYDCVSCGNSGFALKSRWHRCPGCGSGRLTELIEDAQEQLTRV